MNLNRQQKEILAILKACGNDGMNSFEWRARYIQLPARIKELRKLGYSIQATTKKNRSVNYILESEPKQYTWVFEGNTARQVEVSA